MAAVVPLSEAVASLVNDGDTVALEGFTHLIPQAAAAELLRQARRELTLIRMTPDIVYDQLIGMGCAKKLVFSWGGNPGVGSLNRFRDAVEHGWLSPPGTAATCRAGRGSSGCPPPSRASASRPFRRPARRWGSSTRSRPTGAA